MSQTVVLELPDEILVSYQKGATAARKPLEEFLVDRLNEAVSVYVADTRTDTQTESPALPRSEAKLLQQINLGFSETEWAEYRGLIAKRRAGTLLPDEQHTLTQIAERHEQANARRMYALVKLAQLRQIELDILMDELGIYTPGYE
ncbi:MAG: hypothetical protein KJZ86_01015 [Caldilineaceae bacterium]|nr:hypothetical protein [Caldilineaceae bacterium]